MLPSKQQQIDHINEHLVAFTDLTGRKTVVEYFDEYYEDYEHEYGPATLYGCICNDLGIKPL